MTFSTWPSAITFHTFLKLLVVLFLPFLVLLGSCSQNNAGKTETEQLAGAEGSPQSLFKLLPSVVQNPNPRVPLAAVLTFSARQPVNVRVTISDGKRQQVIEFDTTHDPSLGLPLVGMRAGREHKIVVEIQSVDGEKMNRSAEITYVTPPLPAMGKKFPTIDVKTSKPAEMEPGITLLSVRRRGFGRAIWMSKTQLKFSREFSLLLALDNEGEVIWYYESDARIAGVDHLENGNILFQLGDYRTVIIDVLGNKVQEWYAEKRPYGKPENVNAIPIKGIQTLHHQPHQMPNGHFLSFAANARVIENYYTSETDPNAPRATQTVMGDTIIEFDKNGNIIWSWNAFDYLDTSRIGYNTLDAYWPTRGFPNHLDWTHANGVTYDEKRDAILISLRVQDAIISIDRETKEINWILGVHSDWRDDLKSKLLTPIGDNFRWPYHGHNPRVTKQDTIVIYDNGILQARPFDDFLPPDKTFSRGVEFDIDETAMTIRQLWASDHKLTPDTCNGWAMGDAHRLPITDNMLIIDALCVPQIEGISYDQYDTSKRSTDDFPYRPRIREYKRNDTDDNNVNKDMVFNVELYDSDELILWQVYGGMRIPSFYVKNKDE
ncbi:MAG: hypothetical protein COA91_11150 [Robiginitomaculum sp.]|nr:MAG: hypothetical protein COA91_11150 [Robiginitomaculum sp.]